MLISSTMNNLKIDNFNIIYKNIIQNDTSIKANLIKIPRIPNLYFEKNKRNWYTDKIIDNYYIIKVKLEKLKKIKDNLLFIIELNKNKFENIFIDKYKYKLDKRFLIFKKDKLEIKTSGEFKIFKDDFSEIHQQNNKANEIFLSQMNKRKCILLDYGK